MKPNPRLRASSTWYIPRSYCTNSNLASLGATTCYKQKWEPFDNANFQSAFIQEQYVEVLWSLTEVSVGDTLSSILLHKCSDFFFNVKILVSNEAWLPLLVHDEQQPVFNFLAWNFVRSNTFFPRSRWRWCRCWQSTPNKCNEKTYGISSRYS